MRQSKPKLLIIYDYFYPAQRAGGITRSLTYICRNFGDFFDISVISSAYDLGSSIIMEKIESEKWQDFEGKARVFFTQNLTFKKLKKLIAQVKPNTIYLNGVFSLHYSLLPLLIYRLGLETKLVLAPRGMLQQGALEVKPLKKKAFLLIFKMLGFHKHVLWHATDLQESKDIQLRMGIDANVMVVEVAPDMKDYRVEPITKINGQLKLVFISLLTAKKNLGYLLKILTVFDHEVSLDIYGPIKDQAYWEECQALLRKMPKHIQIQYKGAIHPDEVLNALAAYHFFVLPTLGENFGHAIYESLNVGRPVIISDRTPWRDLQHQQAGWDFSLEDENALEAILIKCISMDQDTYDAYCQGAKALARKYVAEAGFEEKYKRLFGRKA